MKELLKDQRGQALTLALIAMALGALLISTFLGYASTNLISSRVTDQSLARQYAADAGVEDALWNLKYGDFTTILADPGDSTSYVLTAPVNSLTPSVTVTKAGTIVASDDFESRGWAGGSGWTASWSHTGDSSVVNSAQPQEGRYHLRLRRGTGYVKRAANMLNKTYPRLQFWAKAWSFEGNENAQCLVSSDGTHWTVVRTWVDGQDDNVYRFEDVDLSPYTMSNQFWIAFDANMTDTSDYLYIDDLRIVSRAYPIDYEIVSTAGGQVIRAGVTIDGSQVDIITWVIE